ncbi:MAG: hypothetical protein QNJ73_15400 [Gammaproteobacteria bacterium]|nr:hypothetical protein [Gammaproteobacteria bacterium]
MVNEKRGVAARIALIALTAAAFLAAAPVQAGQHNRGSNFAAEISPDGAAAIARGATGGRVLKVERKGSVYVVRVLLDGERVRNLTIDARTGRLLN